MRGLAAMAAILPLLLGACGGGSGDSGHPLEGAWSGSIAGSVDFAFRIDASGAVSDFSTSSTSPEFDFVGGTAAGGPDVYTLRLDTRTEGPKVHPFLVDAAAGHGTFVIIMGSSPALGAIGVLEKNVVDPPVYYAPDILGSWTGYGYAYSAAGPGFAPFSPVHATATAAVPDDLFSVTLPTASFDGVFDGGDPSLGAWSGTANVTGARILALLSPDKQFLSVVAFPASTPNAEDYSFFALNRE